MPRGLPVTARCYTAPTNEKDRAAPSLAARSSHRKEQLAMQGHYSTLPVFARRGVH
jgi:hypothetical protein